MSQPHDHGHDHARADANDPDDMHAVHEGPIRTARQLIWTVLGSFLIPIVVIIMLVNFVDFGNRPGAGSDALEAAAVAERLKPVGVVDFRDITNPAAQRGGDLVYQAQCSACHATGVANAPKFGDAAAWGPRIKQGFEVLLTSALKGKGAMGPQGGGDFTDFEVARAVRFMANQGGANFDEPQMPGAATTAAAGAASAPN